MPDDVRERILAQKEPERLERWLEKAAVAAPAAAVLDEPTFSSGPMANRTFEHTIEKDGAVTFREVDSDKVGKPTHAEKSEIASVGEDVYAVSYLASSGYTLTTVLDYRTGRLVAFASNEKELSVHEGTFARPPDRTT